MKTFQTNITYIYSLHSSDEPNRIRYIGKSDTPNIRLKSHIRESKRVNLTHKHRWINKKISQGHKIKLKIIKIVDLNFWKGAEIFFINAFSDCDLTNFANGGNGGCPSKYEFSYDETKQWVIENLNVNSSVQWFKLTKENKIPEFIPNVPYDVYSNSGWIDWNDFLDVNNKKPSDYNYITLSEAKKYINKHFNVNSINEWRILVLDKKIPSFIPNRPERYYKKRGWVSWGNFLETGSIGYNKHNHISYNDAKKHVQNNFKNTKTEKSWRELVKKKLLPNSIPGSPSRYYKNKGWVSWHDWFGK